MNRGIIPLLAVVFSIPLLIGLARRFTMARPAGMGKHWSWFAAAFFVVLAGAGTGLFEGLGINPQAVMQLLLFGGFLMVLLEDLCNRMTRWP